MASLRAAVRFFSGSLHQRRGRVLRNGAEGGCSFDLQDDHPLQPPQNHLGPPAGWPSDRAEGGAGGGSPPSRARMFWVWACRSIGTWRRPQGSRKPARSGCDWRSRAPDAENAHSLSRSRSRSTVVHYWARRAPGPTMFQGLAQAVGAIAAPAQRRAGGGAGPSPPLPWATASRRTASAWTVC